jgi:putative transposon-encoded protein
MIACEIRNTGTSAILEKIMELQQEIAQINLHERAHTGIEGEVYHEPTCNYCQAAEHIIKSDEGRNKKSSIVCELERSVESTGKNGNVLVPKSWAGRRVRVMLLE